MARLLCAGAEITELTKLSRKETLYCPGRRNIEITLHATERDKNI